MKNIKYILAFSALVLIAACFAINKKDAEQAQKLSETLIENPENSLRKGIPLDERKIVGFAYFCTVFESRERESGKISTPSGGTGIGATAFGK